MDQHSTSLAEQHENKKAATPASWRPGVSGNPRGRPRAGNALAEAVRAKVDPDELVAIALRIARGHNDALALQALGWLRDSGYLRPPAQLELGPAGSMQQTRDYSHLSLEEKRELLARLEGRPYVPLLNPDRNVLTTASVVASSTAMLPAGGSTTLTPIAQPHDESARCDARSKEPFATASDPAALPLTAEATVATVEEPRQTITVDLDPSLLDDEGEPDGEA